VNSESKTIWKNRSNADLVMCLQYKFEKITVSSAYMIARVPLAVLQSGLFLAEFLFPLVRYLPRLCQFFSF